MGLQPRAVLVLILILLFIFVPAKSSAGGDRDYEDGSDACGDGWGTCPIDCC